MEPEKPIMNDDKVAQEAIEKPTPSEAAPNKMPPAGPHADQRLTDDSKTPGAGALPDDDVESIDPGAG